MVYSVQDLLYQLESYQVFDFLLPFLLIFAIVFGILVHINIFGGRRGISLIIAFVIGLLAIRSPFFSEFYSELFPRLGVGVVVVLTLLILIGLFVAKEHTHYWFYGLAAIGVVVGIIIIYQSFGNLGWTSYVGSEAVGWIIFAVLLVGLIITVALAAGKNDDSRRKPAGTFTFPLKFSD